jgi:hypothetical protein
VRSKRVKNKTVQEKCKVKSDDRFLIFALLFSAGRGPFLEVRALYYLPAKPLTATAVDRLKVKHDPCDFCTWLKSLRIKGDFSHFI